jgi:hypothetical protein
MNEESRLRAVFFGRELLLWASLPAILRHASQAPTGEVGAFTGAEDSKSSISTKPRPRRHMTLYHDLFIRLADQSRSWTDLRLIYC